MEEYFKWLSRVEKRLTERNAAKIHHLARPTVIKKTYEKQLTNDGYRYFVFDPQMSGEGLTKLFPYSVRTCCKEIFSLD